MRTKAVVILAIYTMLWDCIYPFHRVRCTLPGDLVPWGTKSPGDLVPRGIK